MTVPSPSKIEADPDLMRSLENQDKATLYRLFQAFRNANEIDYEIGAFSTDGWRKIVSHEFPDGVREFLDAYEQLREENVRKTPVIEHLAEHYEIDSDELNVDRLPELVAVIIDEGLLDRLDEIIIAAKFRPSAVTGTFHLDEPVPLDDLEARIEAFHESWNTSDDDGLKKAKRIDIEYQSEQLAALHLYRESSTSTARYFEFRENGTQSRPSRPEIGEFEYRQLKDIRFLIASHEDRTRLIFTKNLNGWHQSLRSVFSEIFGVDDITSKMSTHTSDVVKDVEETAVSEIDKDTDPIAEAQSYIDTRCEAAKSQVEDLGVPSAQKDILNDHLSSISITGTDVEEDQSIATRELRIISQTDLAEMFASVDIEDGFRDLLRKANEENLAFVLDVNGVPVECRNGSWSRAGPGQLPDSVRQAMQLFFDEEAPI